jgi:hypothetical protein
VNCIQMRPPEAEPAKSGIVQDADRKPGEETRKPEDAGHGGCKRTWGYVETLLRLASPAAHRRCSRKRGGRRPPSGSPRAASGRDPESGPPEVPGDGAARIPED